MTYYINNYFFYSYNMINYIYYVYIPFIEIENFNLKST